MIASVLLLLAVSTISLAQDLKKNRMITGMIKLQDSHEAAIGAMVLIKGKGQGTIVDADGNFTLSVSSTDTLVFSFVGYEDQIIPIGNLTKMDVKLHPDVTMLGTVEVVSIGYGKIDRMKLTGSVASLKAKDLDSRSLSFDNALVGKLAGVQVSTTSGQPGSATAITIRGISTFQKDGNNPLVVIDGVPVYGSNRSLNSNNFEDRRSVPAIGFGTTVVSNTFDRLTQFERNPLANINPDDIASIDVLKDAYATAIYGSRGAAGVILVTTKSGKRGDGEIKIGYKVGINQPIGEHNLLSGSEYGRLYTSYYADVNGPRPPGFEFMFDTLNHIDWQEEVVRLVVFQNLNLSMSGGNDKSRFYTSLSISKDPSYVINNDFERYTARINYDYEPHEIITIGTNFQFSFTNNSALNAPSIYGAALTKAPNVPIFDAKGDYVWDSGRLTDYNSIGTADSNPVAIARENTNYLKDFRTLGNLFLEISPTWWFTLRTEVGVDVLNSTAFSREIDRPILLGAGGSAVQTTRNNFRTVLNNTVTFDHAFSKHSINAVFGHSFEASKEGMNRLTGSDFFDDDLLSIGASLSPRVDESRFDEWALESYFGRASYIYDSKYIAGFTYRLDGSSRFASNHQYVGFPSLSLGWVVSEERFLKSVNWLSRLKFRSSLGFSGINGSGETYYGSQGVFDLNALGFTYGDLRSLELIQPLNPNLKWEKTKTLDFGMDAIFFDGFINLTVDYYYKLTTDMLFPSALSLYKGFSSVDQNIGSVENTGIEITLSINYANNDFGWSSSFNIAHNANKILKLNTDGEQAGDAQFNYKYLKEGEPIGQFYLDQWHGVNPETGIPQWLDKNGEITNSPTLEDKKAFGSPMPQFFGGMYNTISYKNMELTASFSYSIGGKLLNGSRAALLTYATPGANNLSREILDYWKKEGNVTDVPKLKNTASFAVDFVSSPNSSRFLEDNTFLRLKTLRLAYNFPKSKLFKASIKRIQYYVEGSNIWTWMQYSGLDPEVTIGGSSAILGGVDYLTMPLVKSWAIGINLTL